MQSRQTLVIWNVIPIPDKTAEHLSALFITIKSADKGSVVAVWDRDDYIKEAEEQLGDKDICEEVCNDPEISTLLHFTQIIATRECHTAKLFV